MMGQFFSVIRRDVLLALRRRSEVIMVLFFFLVVLSLFPLAGRFDHQQLQQIGPGVAWVAALLASTLALERLFLSDYEDGSLDQLMLIPLPLALVVFAKIVAHWILTGLPLVLIAPLVGLWYHLPWDSVLVLMAALLLGTPILSFIGAVPAALTLGLRGGGILIALLVLPLYIPVMVYGSGAVSASMQSGASFDAELSAYFYLLAAFALLATVFVPWLAAAAIRVSTE